MKFAPDYVGIGIRNIDNLNMITPAYYIDDIYERIIKPVRKTTGVPLILGGSGFSVFYEEIMEHFKADYGIVGEGEEVFPYLLRCLDKGTAPDHPAILTRTKSKPDKSGLH